MKRINKLALLITLFIGSSVSTYSDENELLDLYTQATSSFSSADYVTATYYLQRIYESNGWETFSKKETVLRYLAMIEESQSRFDKAARYYKELIDNASAQFEGNVDPMRHYYTLRYAACLERTGMYKTSINILWNEYKNSDISQQIAILQSILEAYSSQIPTQGEIDRLRQEIVPRFVDALGWPYARLLQSVDRNEEAFSIYEQLWPVNPVEALQHVSAIHSFYQAIGEFDRLIEKIDQMEAKAEDSTAFFQFKIELLVQANREEEALRRIEQFIKNQYDVDDIYQPGDFVAILPTPILDHWLDLMVRLKDPELGISMLRAVVDQFPMDLRRRKQLSSLMLANDRLQDAVQLWIDWTQNKPSTPLSYFNAAEEIYQLGDTQTARELLQKHSHQIPHALFLKKGETEMRLGDYSSALASFEIAAASGGVEPVIIATTLTNILDKNPNLDQIVAEFIDAASGVKYNEIKPWIKTTILKHGLQSHFKDRLESLAASEGSGYWYFNLAHEAEQHGDNRWALKLLEQIPESSIFRGLANQQIAMILAKDPSATAQRKAADLMYPSVNSILSVSSTVQLSPSLIERLLEYSERRLNAYQPEEAWSALRKIESASDSAQEPFSDELNQRLLFLRSRVMTELGSFQTAIDGFEQIRHPSYLTDARFMLAKLYIARQDLETAQTMLHQLASQLEFDDRTNDSLSLIVMLEPLVGESLSLFCNAMQYRLQGRFDDAIPLLRQIAVEYYGNEIEEWIRYEIALLKRNAGNIAEAREELERLLVDVDHPVLQGMVRLELLKIHDPDDSRLSDMEEYQDIMIRMPNTIFADLARLEMQQNYQEGQP